MRFDFAAIVICHPLLSFRCCGLLVRHAGVALRLDYGDNISVTRFVGAGITLSRRMAKLAAIGVKIAQIAPARFATEPHDQDQ